MVDRSPSLGSSRSFRSWMSRWLAVCGLVGPLAASDLQVSIQDATGHPTPAAVRLYNQAGNLQIPEQALDLSRMGFLYQPGALIHYADWTSPRVRSQDPFFGSSWFRQQHPKETACFFVDGGFKMQLPPGRYRLIVNKGLEYIPVERIITMGSIHCDETVTLTRWVNMAARGWYSGDDHAHIERKTPAANQSALLWAQAEDVHMCNVLWMGDAKETYYDQYAFGRAGRAEKDGFWLVPGQEEPRTSYLGHTLHLNEPAPFRNTTEYYAYRSVFEHNHGQGLSGFAHVGRRRWFFHVDRGLSLLAPEGLVDFVEVAQMGYIGVTRWYEFLNLGFHLTAMAGNDVPWGGTIGSSRVYACTGHDVNADRWFDAVRQGHTFVTNGPMLDFTVNGQLPGSTLEVKMGDILHIKARAWGNSPGTRPLRLKLVSFGRVLKETKGDGTLEADLTLPADQSFWITSACETNPEPLMDEPGYFSGAVATPVYVEVNGRPTRDEANLAALVQRRMQTLDDIEHWLQMGPGAIDPGDNEGRESAEAFRQSIPEIRRELQAARAYFSSMLESAKTN